MEVCIALFVRDRFVRPYLGDVLAVILVYAGLMAVLRVSVGQAAAMALAIAVAVEMGQLIGILDMLGLRGNAVARVVLGAGFDGKDLIAYLAGAGMVLLVERFR